MDQQHARQMVAAYQRQMPAYRQLGQVVTELLTDVLQGIPIQVITFRVKDPEHLCEKLTRPGKQYGHFTDVTDLLGLRVITYFEDDVDRVVARIDREFEVDPVRSEDKRKLLDPDRFGYASVHKICQLPAAKLAQPEYVNFDGLRLEIQIRSILQHAWAEMEHDLGYKAILGVPGPLRRRFSVLAGLLELADQEFMRLRNDLQAYSQQVSDEIYTAPERVLLDNLSLKAFIHEDLLCRQLDSTIAGAARVETEEAPKSWYEARIAELDGVGVRTIGDLTRLLREWEERIRLHAALRTAPGQEYGPLYRGVCLVVLGEVLEARGRAE